MVSRRPSAALPSHRSPSMGQQQTPLLLTSTAPAMHTIPHAYPFHRPSSIGRITVLHTDLHAFLLSEYGTHKIWTATPHSLFVRPPKRSQPWRPGRQRRDECRRVIQVVHVEDGSSAQADH
ncbi:hypothetical protein HPP92_022069 [Vanilla planifolia]|uniref:Uncharacterized protein n=1 Tax=Vanilla planifolia TaxID=51239 RepID=A0A835PVQ6_VANPL|nr:hypothetical protein HPP92_022069 [Vanilla planifolia]